MRKRVFYPLLAIVFSLAVPCTILAQDGNNDGIPDNEPGGNSGVSDVPLDGGVSLLLAAGVGYGVKKVRDHRKAAQQQPAGEQ